MKLKKVITSIVLVLIGCVVLGAKIYEVHTRIQFHCILRAVGTQDESRWLELSRKNLQAQPNYPDEVSDILPISAMEYAKYQDILVPDAELKITMSGDTVSLESYPAQIRGKLIKIEEIEP